MDDGLKGGWPGANPDQLWRDGAAALRAGDAGRALDLLTRLAAIRPKEPAPQMGRALAAKALGLHAEQERAVDAVLEIAPADIRALMMKADLLIETRGDLVAAAAYFSAVIRIGADLRDLPADLAAEVERATRALDEHQRRFEDHLRSRLAAAGLNEPGGERVAAALDLMLGKTQIFLQEPKQYYFPGLPQIQFYPRSLTPWLEAVEAETSAIRSELLAVLETPDDFHPYLERGVDRPVFDTLGLVDNPAWSAFYLWKNGALVEANAKRCPKTVEAVRSAPLCRIPGRAPAVLFSLLRPGARIPPHNGLLNSRLICHLPLIVPEGCRFRVGNETRPWVEGQAFAFDDSIEHEAWNDSQRLRVVLIFDVWRPELSEREQALVSATLGAVDSFAERSG